MTPADLDRLQQLYEAATPGPWKFRTYEYETGERESHLEAALYSEDNEALIHAMRNALPELLAMAGKFLARENRMAAKRDVWRDNHEQKHRQLVTAVAERDALAARVRELEAGAPSAKLQSGILQLALENERNVARVAKLEAAIGKLIENADYAGTQARRRQVAIARAALDQS